MNGDSGKSDFDPSLHIIPLDNEGHVPLMWKEKDENTGSVIAIAADGRLSCFPTIWEVVLIGGKHKGYISKLEQEIKHSIKEQFPNGDDSCGQKVRQYVLACVMYGPSDKSYSKFIFRVVGLVDFSKELESLYKTIQSLAGTKAGDEKWCSVENYLSSEPVKSWINRFISSLKKQGWSDYVRENLV